MNDQQIKRLLARQAEEAIPDSIDITDAVMRHASTTTVFRGPRLTLRRVAVLAAAIMATMTAVYVVAQGLLQPDPGLQAMQAENQIVRLDQTQTFEVSGDLTALSLTLEYAYADANRIAVAYHASGQAAPGTNVVLYTNPLLQDAEGRSYPWLPSSGQQANASGVAPDDQATQSFEHGGLMSFDASGVQGAPGSLNLTLHVDVAYTTEALRASDPFAMLGANGVDFTFSLPFNPGHTVTVESSATASGAMVTLNRVVVSPSMTRLEVCTDAVFGGDAWPSWQAVIGVESDGQPVISAQPAGMGGLNGAPLSPDASCRALALPANLSGQLSNWTLTIAEFVNPETGQHLAGPWIFQVDMR